MNSIPSRGVIMALSIVMLLAGCRKDDTSELLKESQTVTVLSDACTALLDVVYKKRLDPPKKPHEVLSWLITHNADFATKPYVKNKQILDGWGRPIFVEVRADEYVFGSAGADGVWANGAGDDIVQKTNVADIK